ncbi:MAG: hypothetical protein JXA60_09280 [Candidatus Coatesbacteria bacterium]|nr:hypothetical protein [Candidatus Coatesbacteria bacterium]
MSILANMDILKVAYCGSDEDISSNIFKLRQPIEPSSLEREGVLLLMLDPFHINHKNLGIAKTFLERISDNLYQSPLIPLTIPDTITRIISQVNSSLFQLNQRSTPKSHFGMGLLLIYKSTCFYFNSGGNKFILKRGNRTTVLSPNVGSLEPQSDNTESMLLGVNADLDPKIGRFNHEEGDTIYLVSKQIFDKIKEEDLFKTLSASKVSRDISTDLKNMISSSMSESESLNYGLAIIPFSSSETQEGEGKMENEEDFEEEYEHPQKGLKFIHGILIGGGIGLLLVIASIFLMPFFLNMSKITSKKEDDARIAKQDSIEKAEKKILEEKKAAEERKQYDSEAFIEEMLEKTDKYLAELEKKYKITGDESSATDDSKDSTEKKGKKAVRKTKKKTVKDKDTAEKKIISLRAEYNNMKENHSATDKIIEQGKLVAQFINTIPAPEKAVKKKAKRKTEGPVINEKFDKEQNKLILMETGISRVLFLYYQVLMMVKTEGLQI